MGEEAEQAEPEPRDAEPEPHNVVPGAKVAPTRLAHIICTPTGYWRWFTGFVGTMNAVVGAAALIAAAVVRDVRTSPALLIFGAVWLAVGLVSARQRKRLVWQITLHGRQVEFHSPARGTFTLPASEIIKMTWPWWDPQHMAHLSIRTRSHGVIKAAPRMHELAELVDRLRDLNPEARRTLWL